MFSFLVHLHRIMDNMTLVQLAVWLSGMHWPRST